MPGRRSMGRPVLTVGGVAVVVPLVDVGAVESMEDEGVTACWLQLETRASKEIKATE